MRTLLACIGKYKECTAPLEQAERLNMFVQSNELHSLRTVPLLFWQLCQGVLEFRLQRPNDLPVSLKSIYSWFPDASSNTHKTWVVRTMVKSAPVLLQETKWNQAQLQHLTHSWPEIRVITTLAKHDPKAQAGVAILFPPGWVVESERVLVKHYAVAACVVYQACTIWIASVYIPPQSHKNFAKHILDSILTLEDHPVFVGGDFNRCDQHHFQSWEDFLVQAGLADVDPDVSLPRPRISLG